MVSTPTRNFTSLRQLLFASSKDTVCFRCYGFCVSSTLNVNFDIAFCLSNYLQCFILSATSLSQVGTIPCRKWSFNGQQVQDAVVGGAQKMSTYDHLLTASLMGGFYARYRAAPPQNSLVVGTGSKPYVGFYFANETFTAPVFTDIARVATSIIKSALPSWLTGNKDASQSTVQPAPSVPVEAMQCRFGLCDFMRVGGSIWMAQRNYLAAVADNLGRVVLVDCKKAVAIRIWKGYREAQCCFVEVPERLQKNSKF